MHHHLPEKSADEITRGSWSHLKGAALGVACWTGPACWSELFSHGRKLKSGVAYDGAAVNTPGKYCIFWFALVAPKD